MMESSSKFHALVVPYPAQGHINPMLQFSKRLVSKGVRITFANSVFLSKATHAAPGCSIHFDTISDGYDDGGYPAAESAEDYVEKLRDAGSRTLADLIHKLAGKGQPVSVVIYDSFLTWALDVANRFGLVAATFFTQTSAVNAIYYQVFSGVIPVPISAPVSIPGSPLLFQPDETPSFVHNYHHGPYPGFRDMLVNQFSNIERSDWVFLNIFHKLEEDVLAWMANQGRGPLSGIPVLFPVTAETVAGTGISYEMGRIALMGFRVDQPILIIINLFKPDTHTCMNWLDNQEPGSVVYVSFGSWTVIDAKQVEDVASALKEAGYKFLWVVRAFEMEKLPGSFVDETSDQGLVVTWSPQLEVLAHESTACFVTHCGFSSVLEALSLGVPVVAAPQWTDQPTNGKFLEEVWGVGIRANADADGITTKDALVSCLKVVMEGEKGEEIKRNAIKWKNLAREAIDEGGSSDKNIDEFVAELSL